MGAGKPTAAGSIQPRPAAATRPRTGENSASSGHQLASTDCKQTLQWLRSKQLSKKLAVRQLTDVDGIHLR
jgi:hypothetical protein